MKKVYAVVAALLFAGAGFAQSSTSLPQVPKSQHQRVEASINQKMATPLVQTPAGPSVQKAAPTVYYSDDFSNAANWVVGHDAGTQGDWVIGSTGLGFIGVLNSTSGGDFAGFDSDAQGQGTTNNAWIQMANPVNLTGVPAVLVTWEQVYQRFQDDVFIEVSNNGSTWTTFQVNEDIGTNQATPNPDFRSLDISSAAANQATVWIRFRYQGAWDYAWAVDDIAITSPPNNELILRDVYFNGYADTTSIWHYSQIPVQHSVLDTMVFGAAVSNAGAVTQDNVVLDAVISGQDSWSGQSPTGVSIMPGNTDSVEIGTIYIADQLGTYNIDFAVTSDSTDEQPANNMISRTWDVTETTYARDFDDFAGGFSYAAGTGIHSMALLYEIRQPDTITGMDIMVFNNGAAGTTDGAVVNFHIYDNSLTPIYSNNFVTIDDTWFNTWVTVPFDPPFVASTPGLFMVGYEMLSAADEVWIGQGSIPNISPPVTAFVNVDNGGFGWIDATPFLRMNVTEFVDPCAASIDAEVTNISCNGLTDGELNISVSGGTAPYTYTWSNGSTNEDLTGLAAGDYTVTVEFDAANACVQTETFTIVEPMLLSVDTVTATDEVCGQMDAAATATVSGGTMPYDYAWTNGDVGSTANGLGAGTYSVVVTDDNGCTATGNVMVTGSVAVTATESSMDATCGLSDGSATVTPATGVAPFSYMWSSGDTTATADSLGVGTYVVTIMDSIGCSATQSVNVSNVGAPTLTVDTMGNVGCNGGADGFITISATGAGLSYNWSNGDTSNTASGLMAGTYTVTVTDLLSCASIWDGDITEPTMVMVAGSTTPVTCNGDADGTATAVGTGGTGTLSYLWSNGGTSGMISGLAGGMYMVTVTDANGCTAVDGWDVVEPDALMASVTPVDVDCFGGSDGAATCTVTGGTGTPDYLWSNGANSQNISGLGTGTYTVSVTDDNGCTATADGTVGEPAAALSVTVTGSMMELIPGNNGSIDIDVSGGTSPYQYSWTSGSTVEDPSDLTGGTHTVTVTDANGCTSSATETIGSNVGIEEVEKAIFSVYPNPNNGSFNVAFGTDASGKYLMTVTDLVGKVVYSENLTVNGGLIREVNLNGLSKGVYMLNVEGDTKTVERIVIR